MKNILALFGYIILFHVSAYIAASLNFTDLPLPLQEKVVLHAVEYEYNKNAKTNVSLVNKFFFDAVNRASESVYIQFDKILEASNLYSDLICQWLKHKKVAFLYDFGYMAKIFHVSKGTTFEFLKLMPKLKNIDVSLDWGLRSSKGWDDFPGLLPGQLESLNIELTTKQLQLSMNVTNWNFDLNKLDRLDFFKLKLDTEYTDSSTLDKVFAMDKLNHLSMKVSAEYSCLEMLQSLKQKPGSLTLDEVTFNDRLPSNLWTEMEPFVLNELSFKEVCFLNLIVSDPITLRYLALLKNIKEYSLLMITVKNDDTHQFIKSLAMFSKNLKLALSFYFKKYEKGYLLELVKTIGPPDALLANMDYEIRRDEIDEESKEALTSDKNQLKEEGVNVS